jgi:aminopeptidase N
MTRLNSLERVVMETSQMIAKETPQPIYLKDYKVPDFAIGTVELTFELEEQRTVVTSRLAVQRTTSAKNLVLNGEELSLVSVKLNGNVLNEKNYHLTNKLLTIFNVPDQFELEIQNTISPINNTALSGLYVSRHNFCTQCESEGFRRITYFLDRPDVMATYTTTIVADKKRYPLLLSNGNPVASGELENGRHWVKWQDPFKKPSYLFALVAGDFECLSDKFTTMNKRNIDLRIYVEKGDLDKCRFAMEAVKRAMRWDEETYGREYDLDIYMIVAVSDFNFGAMENKGLNIFNTKYILANPATATDTDFINVESVIAHEYFHNWSGNRITCRDWFQLSLKEGLTIFRDQGFTEDMTSKTVAHIQDVTTLRNVQFPEDNGPLAHPVRPDSYIEIGNFYTATVYEKGAQVIRMMRTILGKDTFRKAMDLYFKRHDGQAVTIEEFVKAMEDASNRDLTQFRLWYSQAGTPILEVTDHFDAAKQTYRLTVKQTIPPTPGQAKKLPMDIPLDIGLIDKSGKEVRRELLHVNKEMNQYEFSPLTEKPIPSLLRDFSAPVKVHYNYTDADLLFLFQNDTDEFNCWEAGQNFATRLILRLIENYRSNKPLQVPAEYFATLKEIIKKRQHDKLLLAEFLTLPSEKYISEQMTIVDVDAIHHVRELVLREIAQNLRDIFITLYRENHTAASVAHFDLQQMAQRRIKNLSLGYLMLLSDKTIYSDFAMAQFKNSLTHNMTDTLAALVSLSQVDIPERVEALNQFYQQWRNEALVVDKWIMVQANSMLPGTLEQVKKLMQHEAFDIKNPNKVYALIGGFSQNAVHFHAINGEGYAFLADVVLQLDKINPMVAARMVKPLTSWKRYDKERQQLMKAQLERLLGQKLSKDVYELVKKSL